MPRKLIFVTDQKYAEYFQTIVVDTVFYLAIRDRWV